jgi:EAL domain-containing protein (putative c-di-GMP-specific phosphodiesterase class I)
MLMIASATLKVSDPINAVVREMSLGLAHYSTPAGLSERLAGSLRCLLLLSEDDLNDDIFDCLSKRADPSRVGIIVAADSKPLRTGRTAKIVDFLVAYANAEWIGRDCEFDRFVKSANRCRRRLLKVSQDALENAFDQCEFIVQYQPKVERVESGDWQTREAEALVRWRHPEHGLLAPLEFLPEIEAFGLMGQLTEYVLRKSAGQLGKWEEQGLFLRACVNLASSQLGAAGLGEHYAAIIGEFGLECDRFTFEVVERDLSDRDAPQMRALESLRSAGFRLCLDNFRVAAASLGALAEMPFDEIKIHASTLRRAREDEVARKVLAAVTGLAHSLGMSVCAEGVEDEETLAFLRMIECDKMQGFLISEAVMPHILRRVYSRHDEAVA